MSFNLLAPLTGLQPLSVNGVSDIQIEQPIISPRPSQQTGTFQTSQGIMSPSQLSNALNNAGIQATYNDNTMQQYNQGMSTGQPITALGDASLGAFGPTSPGVSSSGSSMFAWMSERPVSAIVGLICIAAGLFMFKGARETIITTAKGAAKLAA